MATTAPDTCADSTVCRTASTTPSKLADSPAPGDCTTAVANPFAAAEPAAGLDMPAIAIKPDRYSFSTVFLLNGLAERRTGSNSWPCAIP
jgi:hypothetical protein